MRGLLTKLGTRNKRKPFKKPVLRSFDSGSEEEFVLSNIDSFEEEDSGEYVPDAQAEAEIKKQDQVDEAELKKNVKFESGAMEEEIQPARKSNMTNTGWGMFNTSGAKKTPTPKPKPKRNTARSTAVKKETTGGKVNLKKNIDIENFDPLHFIGERECENKNDHYNEEGGFNYDNFEKSTPIWARPKNRRDKNGNPTNHPDYDPTSIFIPKDAWKKFTPAIAQYWKVKELNFEKVIFFKLGKFYEFLFEDAITGAKELGIKFMGNKLHAGFPEAALDKYAQMMVAKGYTVGIVE
jgi:DNA mismatch repair protein MSH6